MKLNDLHLLGAGNLPTEPGWRIKPHSHPHHEIIVIVKGIEHATIRGQTFHGPSGTVFFWPAGNVHEEWTDPQRPFESYFIAFRAKEFTSGFPIQIHDAKGRIRQLITWIYADRHSHSAHAFAAQTALLRTLLLEFAQIAEYRSTDHELVTTVQGYIHDRLAERISLVDLARHAGISKYHFLRTYRALTRRTPMQEVRTMRLRRAQELILGTTSPLKEIAVRCGFSNEYLLSRLFRKQFGMPPGELRRTRRR
jgi:AraC-like DNA-binding protein